jgi:hypothetical protein
MLLAWLMWLLMQVADAVMLWYEATWLKRVVLVGLVCLFSFAIFHGILAWVVAGVLLQLEQPFDMVNLVTLIVSVIILGSTMWVIHSVLSVIWLYVGHYAKKCILWITAFVLVCILCMWSADASDAEYAKEAVRRLYDDHILPQLLLFINSICRCIYRVSADVSYGVICTYM